MSEREKEVLDRLAVKYPESMELDEFGKGHILGTAEGIAMERERQAKKTPNGEETEG